MSLRCRAVDHRRSLEVRVPSGHGYRGDTGVDTNVDAARLEACATAIDPKGSGNL
jgi:hypothetical protein